MSDYFWSSTVKGKEIERGRERMNSFEMMWRISSTAVNSTMRIYIKFNNLHTVRLKMLENNSKENKNKFKKEKIILYITDNWKCAMTNWKVTFVLRPINEQQWTNKIITELIMCMCMSEQYSQEDWNQCTS